MASNTAIQTSTEFHLQNPRKKRKPANLRPTRALRLLPKSASVTLQRQTPDVTLRPPPSPEALLSLEFASLLRYLCMLDVPVMGDAPRYVGGHDLRVDNAARAAVVALPYRLSANQTSRLRYLHYTTEAVKGLRTSIGTDDASLVAIFVLAISERLANEPWKSQAAHFRGIHAVLAARPRSTQSEGLGSAMIAKFATIHLPFLDYCLRDEPSLWDEERWLSLDLRDLQMSSRPELTMLAHVSFHLYIRLPRLISLARKCNAAFRHGRSSKHLEATCALAKELLQLKNLEAENTALHGVRVVGSAEFSSFRILKHHLDFGSHRHLELAMDYWKLRLMAVNIAGRLHKLSPQSFDKAALVAAQESLATTLLMILPEKEQSAAAMDHLPDGVILALLALYAALIDKASFRKVPAAFVRDWIWRTIRALTPQTACDLEDVQASAEMLSGGPIEGILTKLNIG